MDEPQQSHGQYLHAAYPGIGRYDTGELLRIEGVEYLGAGRPYSCDPQYQEEL